MEGKPRPPSAKELPGQEGAKTVFFRDYDFHKKKILTTDYTDFTDFFATKTPRHKGFLTTDYTDFH